MSNSRKSLFVTIAYIIVALVVGIVALSIDNTNTFPPVDAMQDVPSVAHNPHPAPMLSNSIAPVAYEFIAARETTRAYNGRLLVGDCMADGQGDDLYGERGDSSGEYNYCITSPGTTIAPKVRKFRHTGPDAVINTPAPIVETPAPVVVTEPPADTCSAYDQYGHCVDDYTP